MANQFNTTHHNTQTNPKNNQQTQLISLLSDQLKRQNINYSDSLVNSIVQLETIKTLVETIEENISEKLPCYEHTAEYNLFIALDYLIKGFIGENRKALDKIEKQPIYNGFADKEA